MNTGKAYGGSLHGQTINSMQSLYRNGQSTDPGAEEYLFASIQMTAPGQERAAVAVWLFLGVSMTMRERLNDIIGCV